MLFANFLLSADAQTALAQAGRVPTRIDVDPDPQDLVRGLRIHLTLPASGAEARDLEARYADLWR
jgi:hypothetical protein